MKDNGGASSTKKRKLSGEPTGATAKPPAADALGKQKIDIYLRDMNPYLVCKICDGYFRDAHTITECVHSFCKICLWRHFGSSNKCPACETLLKPAQLKDQILQDHLLQEVVDKMFPEMVEADKQSEREFLKRIEEAEAAKLPGHTAGEAGGASGASAAVASSASSTAAGAAAAGAGGGAAKAAAKPKPKAKKTGTDKQHISFLLKPYPCTDAPSLALPRLAKPMLRTLQTMKMSRLRKYLMDKLGLNSPDDIELLCRNELLGKEHTLQYVLRTCWQNAGGADLLLHYRRNAEAD